MKNGFDEALHERIVEAREEPMRQRCVRIKAVPALRFAMQGASIRFGYAKGRETSSKLTCWRLRAFSRDRRTAA